MLSNLYFTFTSEDNEAISSNVPEEVDNNGSKNRKLKEREREKKNLRCSVRLLNFGVYYLRHSGYLTPVKIDGAGREANIKGQRRFYRKLENRPEFVFSPKSESHVSFGFDSLVAQLLNFVTEVINISKKRNYNHATHSSQEQGLKKKKKGQRHAACLLIVCLNDACRTTIFSHSLSKSSHLHHAGL